MEVFLTVLYIENSIVYLTLRRKLFFSLCNGWLVWELRFFSPVLGKQMQCYLETIDEISVFIVSVLTWDTQPKHNVLQHDHFMYHKQANHCLIHILVQRSCIIRASYLIEFLLSASYL